MFRASYLYLALSVLAMLGLTTIAAAAPEKIATVEGITEYHLDNGLRLLLYPDLSRPKVTVNMTVLVGSRHEGYGESGMAHLLEHMLFKGTWAQPNIPQALQDHGAQFNGSTSTDRTNYYETVPGSDENLEFFIRMEADRLVNSLVRKGDLDSEMTVVRNEFERGENSATGVLMRRISAAAYDWHNYAKLPIGNRSDIENVPIDRLQAFYRKYYQPDNAVLLVAGSEDKTVALARARVGYASRPRLSSISVGGPDAFAALSLGVHLAHRAGRISDHDALVGRKVGWVLTGGGVPHRTTVTEQDLLDLEREAFLSLCGERKTQDRIAFTLDTGKTLRN
jgi:zinc protease